MKVRVFDSDAEKYEKIRPDYPNELYEVIFTYSYLHENSFILEIGPGAGNATLPFLLAGCHVTAIEYGKNFSPVCRRKFRYYPKFSLINGRFENIHPGEKFFDLVFSATAFHWISESIGYPKVFSLLKKGGTFARFANHPFPAWNEPEMREELDKIYGEYYYKLYQNKRKFSGFVEDQARDCALAAQKYGFTDTSYVIFNRNRYLSAQEYIMLLGTYSDHMSMPQPMRSKFFNKIEKIINNHGGQIHIFDTIDLELARKP